MNLKKLKKELDRKKDFLRILNILKEEHEDLSEIKFNHNVPEEKNNRTLEITTIWNKYNNYSLKNLKKELMEFNEIINDKYNATVRNGGLHILINDNQIRVWEKKVNDEEEKYEELEYKQLQKDLLLEDKGHKIFQTDFLKYQKKFLEEEKEFRKVIIQENRNIRNLTIVLSFIGIAALIYYLSDIVISYFQLNNELKSTIFFITTALIVLLIGLVLFFLTSIDISDVMKKRNIKKFLAKYIFILIVLISFVVLIHFAPYLLHTYILK